MKTNKPTCFGNIDFDSDKCANCPVLGQCYNNSQVVIDNDE